MAGKKVRQLGVQYDAEKDLDIRVLLYLRRSALEIHDVDNRLKDILDALQGKLAGTKQMKRKPVALIRNDTQIWRVVVEKQYAKAGDDAQGWLQIRPYKAGNWRSIVSARLVRS
jgi:hypothetical protein